MVFNELSTLSSITWLMKFHWMATLRKKENDFSFIRFKLLTSQVRFSVDLNILIKIRFSFIF